MKSEKEDINFNLKHNLFSLSINEVNEVIKLPQELYDFYENVGYGFFYISLENLDRLIDVFSFKKINLKEDYYKHDPDLELYDNYPGMLIFYELNEGVYLLIDKKAKNGRNAIYYFDEKIADSLEEFLIRFDREGHYFIDNN